jgi:hypothetical protein
VGKIFFFLLFSLSVRATVTVAFFRFYDQAGQLIVLTPDGPFAHVAILTDVGWLHSSPANGVELLDNLEKIGEDYIIIKNKELPDVKYEDIKKYLGLKYDRSFTWENSNSSYCSKLIANILNIQPKPMSFEAKAWKGSVQSQKGKLGLSPNDIFYYFLNKNKEIKNDCLKQLEFFLEAG